MAPKPRSRPPSPLSLRNMGGAKRGKKNGRGRASSYIGLDEVSVVEETNLEMGEEHGIEVDSQHEVDATLAPQEACMEIVPYIVQPEVDSMVDTSEENKIYMDRGEDILQKTRMISCFECPPIPLCRLIPHARVRGLRDELSSLKVAFGNEGYVAKKGAFIVSLWTVSREESLVTDEIMAEWDDHWRDVDKEFENDLAKKEEFEILSHRMFYVWEGNHRTVAWTAAIKERFKNTRDKHCRVLCTVIDPTRVPELALLTTFQRMNFLTSHALVATTLRDEIVNCANICASNYEDYVKDLPEKDRKLVAHIRKKYTKGAEPWYPLTRRYLGKLLYNVQITQVLSKKLDQAKLSMSEVELKLFEAKEVEELATRYGDRIGKAVLLLAGWRGIVAFQIWRCVDRLWLCITLHMVHTKQMASRQRMQEIHAGSRSTILDDDVDAHAGDNPYDYVLPNYAEAMARCMTIDPRCDVDPQERPRKRSLFIDDECDST